MLFFHLAIIIFSLTGIFFLIGAKIFEIRNGKLSFLNRLSVFADPTVRLCLEKINYFISQFNKEKIGNFVLTALRKIFYIFGIVGLFISKYHKSFVNAINGKRFLKHRGVVSFFLKNVTESKREEKKDM